MILTFTNWLQDLPFAQTIAQGDWYFPGLECLHVLALAVVFGSISMVDLRLVNLALKSRSIVQLEREVLPWTWIAFCLAVITGGLMFSSAATRYYGLWPFKVKMLLLACAGLNMLVFNLVLSKDVASWEHGATPVKARVAGWLSLILWTAIIVCGRWVGFL